MFSLPPSLSISFPRESLSLLLFPLSLCVSFSSTFTEEQPCEKVRRCPLTGQEKVPQKIPSCRHMDLGFFIFQNSEK